VEAGYRLFRENHPGWYDKTNSGFRVQLRRALDLGLKAAQAAKSERGYEDALGTFSAILSDGHARLIGIDSEPTGVERWPGFTSAWRGQQLLVADAGPSSPAPVGAEITACDGRPIHEFIIKRLASRGMRASEAGQWWSKAPRALIDSSDAAGAPPRDCVFRIGSRSMRRALHWSPAPADMPERLKRASDGELTPIGLRKPRPGLFLIGLPDFEPDEAGRAAYRQLFAQLKARRADLRHARAVIIDLRHNDGGSDDWSLETARALWGRGPVEEKIAALQKPVQIWWRASTGNIAYVKQLELRLRDEGRIETAEQIGRAAQAMEAARQAGHPFALDPKDDSQAPRSEVQSDFSTPVYVITPGRCASACLDAVDTFTQFRNTTLIGAPTSADSEYLEIRTEPLPSGHGIAIIPTKAWMHRSRKGGQIYKPDVEATQLDWSTNAFIDLVEGLLNQGRP